MSENIAAWAKDPDVEAEEAEEEADDDDEDDGDDEKRDKGKGRKYSVEKDGLPQHIKDLIENTRGREQKSKLINKLYTKDPKTGRYKINADLPEFEDFHIHILQFHISLYLTKIPYIPCQIFLTVHKKSHEIAFYLPKIPTCAQEIPRYCLLLDKYSKMSTRDSMRLMITP